MIHVPPNRPKREFFTKKPIMVVAFKLHPKAMIDVFIWPDWLYKYHARSEIYLDIDGVAVRTPEGTMRADEGDWIIQGVNGEIYPCKPDIFEKTYDEKSDEVAS